MKKIILLVFICLIFSSCGNANEESSKEITINSISCQNAKEKANNGSVLIDVRTKEEYDTNHLENALNIPLDVLENNVSSFAKDKEIIVYCQSGKRSKSAAETLKKLGYTKIYDLGSINNCN